MDTFVPDLHDGKGEVKAARAIGIVLNRLIILIFELFIYLIFEIAQTISSCAHIMRPRAHLEFEYAPNIASEAEHHPMQVGSL